MRSQFRVYIKPFDDEGRYTTYQEVTEDVDLSSFGDISQDLDNVDYTIGVYRSSNISLTFRNDSGKYSDVGFPQSIFKFARANSLVKITFTAGEMPFCGFFLADGNQQLCTEETVFEGLLNDDSLEMDLSTQECQFTLLGLESVFTNTTVPLLSNDTFSNLIFACLDQDSISKNLIVDLANISVGVDITTDSVDDFSNKTVQEALDDLLLLSNSVLFIKNGSVIVSPRSPTADILWKFYGQASIAGVEDIENLSSIKNGLSRTFNYLSWKDGLPIIDNDSVKKYGIRSKIFDFTHITDTTNQNTILDAILSEFSTPKQEFVLETPIIYKTLTYNLLDRGSVDYPTVLVPGESGLPICGLAICGVGVLPTGRWSFNIPASDNYKIIGRTISQNGASMKFKMRKI